MRSMRLCSATIRCTIAIYTADPPRTLPYAGAGGSSARRAKPPEADPLESQVANVW